MIQTARNRLQKQTEQPQFLLILSHMFPKNFQKISVLMFEATYPPPVIGGKEKQAHLLSRELVRLGVKVKVLSYIHNGNTSGEHEGILVDRVPRGIAALPLLLWHLMRYRSKFRILHIHTPSRIGKIVAVFGFMLRYKVVFKFPNEHLLDNSGFIESFSWKIILKLVDLFVVLEYDTRQKLIERNIPIERIFQVSNGAEIPDNPCNQQDDELFKMLFVGRLMPQKSCDDLINACSLLDKKKVDWKLTIVGDGPLYKELRGLCNKLGMGDRVFFKGYQADPLSYMKKSDLLVLPSKKEGMSNVLLEAMSVGLPIIATRVGSARIQVGYMGEQFLYEVGDINTLVKHIEKMGNDYNLRYSYADYLRSRCRDEFSIEMISCLYLEKYRNIISC
jgi:glycosyltransferase involved in cell wall biosynthesis